MPIVTLDAIKKKTGGGGRGGEEGEEDSASDGGNDYYAGGNNAQGGSGIAVHAPGDKGKKKSPQDALRRAMELAARQSSASGSSSSQGGSRSGSGGSSSDRRLVTVTAYRNGFVVDDGPFRPLGDKGPNDEFAEALAEGYCPSELVTDGKPANVKLEDKSSEDFTEEKPRYVAFAGAGSSVGEISESFGDNWIAFGSQSSGAVIVVDDSKAKVRVQVKYPEGGKEVLKFEPHHTVRHLLARIEMSRPSLGTHYMVLAAQSGAPKPLDPGSFSLTISEAGLNGASVTVKGR